MKFCVDCKYFTGMNYCAHPNNGVDLVEGKAKTVFATTNRSHKAPCGEEGNWFVEKEPEKKPTLLERIRNVFTVSN